MKLIERINNSSNMKWWWTSKGIYMEVTRDLVQSMPSQLLPQGSEPFQLGGMFVQSKDFKPIIS